MNFIKSAQTVNFIISILSLNDSQLSLTIKPMTDDAKTYCNAKKIKKTDSVVIGKADLDAKITSLENGVSALAALLAA